MVFSASSAALRGIAFIAFPGDAHILQLSTFRILFFQILYYASRAALFKPLLLLTLDS